MPHRNGVPTYHELCKMPNDEIIEKIDSIVGGHTGTESIMVPMYRDELVRRRQDRWTKQVRNMTIVMTVVAAVNLVFIILAYRAGS
jgi:hypothetical protein